jgi:hypothetical protein
MFGSLAFLSGDRMCSGVANSDLVLRVVAEDLSTVMKESHVRPMDSTGRPLRGFVYVGPGGNRTARELRAWIDRGLRFLESREAPTTANKHRIAVVRPDVKR